jgi:hypothetical protein
VRQQINCSRDSGLGARGAVHTARAPAQSGKADDFRRIAPHGGWLESQQLGRHLPAPWQAAGRDRVQDPWLAHLLSRRCGELRLERRLFAGITAWSPLDIFDAGSSAVYFVGDPEGIADNVKVYRDEAKLSALILSGWPLIDEAETVSQLLHPRLNEIE